MTSPYNVRYDPHAKTFFDQTYVQKRLAKNNLVYPDGLVRCNAKEFNDYLRSLSKRIYLANVTNTQTKMASDANFVIFVIYVDALNF